MENRIKLFNQREIRTIWDETNEKWLFSVVDIVAVLSNSADARNYWKVLKSRLNTEGSELVTFCNQLKLRATDGKMRLTDVLDTQGILRLVQSIPSPNAEPFKLWLAKVGNERIDEIADPEIAINRALDFYRKKGYSEGWINQRLKSIEIRKELTDEWDKSGVKKGVEYAILTDEYKNLKGLKKENLRDNMTNLELVLTMLAEASTAEISKEEKPKNFDKSKEIARRGGNVAKTARKELEKQSGKKIVTTKNNLIGQPLHQLRGDINDN